MMAYADLNAPAKSSGFKGPAVKDVKREATSKSFQSSNKARDWRTLDQSLESAFSKGPQMVPSGPVNPIGDVGAFFQASPSNQPTTANPFQVTPTSYQTAPYLSTAPSNPYSAPAYFAAPAVPSNFAAAPAVPSNFAAAAAQNPGASQPDQGQDDWGDFQAFPTPATSQLPLAPGQPTPAPFPSFSPGIQQPVFNYGVPTAASQQLTPQQLQFTSQMAALTPSTAFAQQAVSLPEPGNRESVGCRLASFQEESPVHRFKPAPPVATQKSSSSDDFGDFADFQSASAVPLSLGVNSSIVKPPTMTLTSSTVSAAAAGTLQPTAQQSGQDKYSALRDIFGEEKEGGGDVSGTSGLDTSSDNLILQDSGPSPRIPTQSSPGILSTGLLKPSTTSSSSLLNTSGEQLLGNSGGGVPANQQPANPNYTLTSPNLTQANTSFTLPSPGSGLLNPFTSPSPNNSGVSNFIGSSPAFIQPSQGSNAAFPTSFSSTLPNLMPANNSSLPPLNVTNQAGGDFWSLDAPASSAGASNPWSIEPTADDEDEFGDFGDFTSAPANNVVKPASFPPPIAPVLPGLSSLSLQPTPVASLPVGEDEEFDEWSIPSSALDQRPESCSRATASVPIKATAIHGIFPEQNQMSSTVPYFSSSPPVHCSTPPPLETSPSVGDGLDFQLPSDQLQLSDQELFGTAAVQKKSTEHQHQQPSSLHDVIHLQLAKKNIGESKLKPSKEYIESLPSSDQSVLQTELVEDQAESLKSSSGSPKSTRGSPKSTRGSPKSTRESPNSTRESPKSTRGSPKSPHLDVVTSPESVSVASLEFEQDSISSRNEDERTESKENDQQQTILAWQRCLEEVNTILESTKNTFSGISSSEVREEVTGSETGSTFLRNLREVYIVAYRIQTAAQSLGLEDTGLLQLQDSIQSSWKQIKMEASDCLVLDMSNLNLGKTTGTSSCTDKCGICLNRVEQEVIANDVNTGVITNEGVIYHAGCANFWVNCVDSQLPALS